MKKIIKKREFYLRNTTKENISSVTFNIEILNNLSNDIEKIRDIYKILLNLGINHKNTKNALIVLKVLYFIRNNFYNETSKEHSNWWHWEIGYPLLICDILILFNDYYKKEDIRNLLSPTFYFQPNPEYSGNNPVAIHPSGSPLRKSTGGNRVDLCKLHLLRGLLLNDYSQIKEAIKALYPVWEINKNIDLKNLENRDGFYEDGSFIQHGYVPYAGTYGNVLLSGIGEIFYLIKGLNLINPLEIPLIERIKKSFEPFLYKGSMSDLVNGRAITRNYSNHKIAHDILNSIFLISDFYEYNDKIYLLSLIKREILSDNFFDHIKEEQNEFFKKKYVDLLENSTIKPLPYKDSSYIFNEMNRVFYKTNFCSIGLAMHSNKIANYESFNGENIYGWYTGDGAIYIEDRGDSYIDYWKNIDFYFIPGTTEILEDMKNKNTSNSLNNMSKSKIAFAFNNGKNIHAIMDFINYDNCLSSRKEYILSENKIFYKEFNIKTKKKFYTTIENKKVYNKKSFFIEQLSEKITLIKIDNREYIITSSNPIKFKFYGENNNFLKIWIEYEPINLENLIIEYKITIYNFD